MLKTDGTVLQSSLTKINVLANLQVLWEDVERVLYEVYEVEGGRAPGFDKSPKQASQTILEKNQRRPSVPYV